MCFAASTRVKHMTGSPRQLQLILWPVPEKFSSKEDESLGLSMATPRKAQTQRIKWEKGVDNPKKERETRYLDRITRLWKVTYDSDKRDILLSIFAISKPSKLHVAKCWQKTEKGLQAGD